MRLSKNANERLWDAVIKEALIEDCNIELREFEQIKEEHVFSMQFEKKINKIRNSIAVKEYINSIWKFFKNLIITVAAIMGIVFSGMLTEPQVYAAVKNVVRNIFSDHDNFTHKQNNGEIIFDKNKTLEYIPDGYTLRSVFYADNSVFQTYDAENGQEIQFDYGLAESSSISIDNERHFAKEINIENQKYYYYAAIEENDFNSLIWYNNGYVYIITSQISEEEIVEIAENFSN